MDVIEILHRAEMIAPRWVVNVINATGSVLAIVTLLRGWPACCSS